MSANNEIYIIKNPNGSYSVYDHDVDTEEDGMFIDLANDLEGAVRIAHNYMEENEVEYGLRIELSK